MARMLRQSARPTPRPEKDSVPCCGWFDSSHELQSGLNVTVHDAADALAALLPLAWWLQWELDAIVQPVAARCRSSPSATH